LAFVVVLTGSTQEALGLECIKAGATDYLGKDDLDRHELRRAVVFALARQRNEELMLLKQRLEQKRRRLLGTERTVNGPVDGTLSARELTAYAGLRAQWIGLLEAYVSFINGAGSHPRASIDLALDGMMNTRAGAQDQLELHLEALGDTMSRAPSTATGVVANAARLLAFETLGGLCDRYMMTLESTPPVGSAGLTDS